MIKIGIDMRMAGEGYGIGRYVIELAKALIRRQPKDIVYTLIFDAKGDRFVHDYFAASKIRCVSYPLRYYSWAEQAAYPLILLKQNFDLVHFPNFNVPIFYPKKFVVTIHDLIHHKFPGTRKKNFIHRLGYKAAIKTAAARSKRIISVSESTRHDIIRVLRADEKKIRVIYEGVSPVFSPRPGYAEDLGRYGIRQPYILSVGVWRKYKNLQFLVDAYLDLKINQQIPQQLVLVGEADKNYPQIQTDIVRLPASAGIVAPGKVPEADLIKIYSNADLYVSPSLSEGFGLTVLEAQACGTAAISSDILVAREILADSVEYFDPKNLQSLRELLVQTLSDRENRQVLKTKAFVNLSRFTWEKAAEQTEGLYREIVTSK